MQQTADQRARGMARGPAPGPRSAGAQRVLHAALDLFGQFGFEGTSLQQIADRMGVTKAAVYYHFRTKDEILSALVAPLVAELAASLDDASRLPRVADRRKQGLRDLVDCLVRHRRLAGFLSRDVGALGRLDLQHAEAKLSAAVQALLLGREPEPEDRLALLWGGAALGALGSATLAVADAPEDWLREELTALGRHMGAGYQAAWRRTTTPAEGHGRR